LLFTIAVVAIAIAVGILRARRAAARGDHTDWAISEGHRMLDQKRL